jgi:transcriptional regulator with XRE-family HTH domain
MEQYKRQNMHCQVAKIYNVSGTPMPAEQLVDWITTQLNDRDWSQNKLARAAHLSPSQVSRVMNGQRPSPEIARAIGDALGVSGEFILKLSGRLDREPPGMPKNMEEWTDLFKHANPDQREKLLKMARELLRVLKD